MAAPRIPPHLQGAPDADVPQWTRADFWLVEQLAQDWGPRPWAASLCILDLRAWWTAHACTPTPLHAARRWVWGDDEPARQRARRFIADVERWCEPRLVHLVAAHIKARAR